MANLESLPTIVYPTNYHEQLANNNEHASQLLAVIFPQITIPYDHLFNIISYLEETGVNPAIIPQVIRGIHNLFIGTGRGQVIVHVSKNKSNVEIRETSVHVNTKG